MKGRSRNARRLVLRGLTDVENNHIIRALCVEVGIHVCETIDRAQNRETWVASMRDGAQHSGISTNYSITLSALPYHQNII
jgi:hypothetical protein